MTTAVHKYEEGRCTELIESASAAISSARAGSAEASLSNITLPSTMYKAPFNDLECVAGGFGPLYTRFIAANAPPTALEVEALRARGS